MIQQQDLPLSDLLDEERFIQAFAEHGIDFGSQDDALYTLIITLWALISQVFFAQEQRSCQVAVDRVCSLWANTTGRLCHSNTGAYSRARHKIFAQLLRSLTQGLAEDAQSELDQLSLFEDAQATDQLTPELLAQIKTQPESGRILLVDGTTVTVAATALN